MYIISFTPSTMSENSIAPHRLNASPVTNIINHEFVNFSLVEKFHSEHPSSRPQTSPDYVISSWLHNSIFFVFIGEVWTMREPLQSRVVENSGKEIVKKVTPVLVTSEFAGLSAQVLPQVPLCHIGSGKNQSFCNSASRDELPDAEFHKVDCNTQYSNLTIFGMVAFT